MENNYPVAQISVPASVIFTHMTCHKIQSNLRIV